MNQDLLHPFTQNIHTPAIDAAGIRVFVYRLDLAHPQYSGNKYYKLKGLAVRLTSDHCDTVASFGGRWSNHLLALSQYGKDHGFHTIGLVRDVAQSGSTPLLAQCEANGMSLHYLSAAAYRARQRLGAELAATLGLSGSVYVVPEGGSSEAAITGCEAIVAELNDALGEYYQHVVVPVGTGATMAGLVRACADGVHVHGVAVTKKYAEQAQQVKDAQNESSKVSWSIERLTEMGAYGVLKAPLVEFIHAFERAHAIKLDPNYTAKAFYWFHQTLASDKFLRGDTVVLLHTGGLMGRLGFPEVFADEGDSFG